MKQPSRAGGAHAPRSASPCSRHVLLAGAVAASPGRAGIPMNGSDVTPLAAVDSAQRERTGVAVVALAKPPAEFRVAAATGLLAPAPGRRGERRRRHADPGRWRCRPTARRSRRWRPRTPGCGVSWNLLAGIGRIESQHANGGATDARGTAVRPIYGPALDGTCPATRSSCRATWAGAQSTPGRWGPCSSCPGHGRGTPPTATVTAGPTRRTCSTPALSAARYLCSGGLNLRNQAQVLTAILRYNNSMAYAQNVLGWAAAYATGVAPVDLPAITGPIPALGDAHLETPRASGPACWATHSLSSRCSTSAAPR